MPEELTRKIRDVNAMIRALVEQETLEYPFWAGGVISSYSVSDYGHMYFTLNDGDYSIRCMVREERRGTLEFPIGNGMDVSVYGTIRVFEKRASVEIEVEQIRLNKGEKPSFDDTVLNQLKAQGLWPKPKKPLPPNIRRIGLITSRHSEALRDFESTYRSEHAPADWDLIDVRLQSAREIADAIDRCNREKQVDVIAIVRGGGRAAELSIFDELVIAEAICRSNIPVITGIGHQRDDTIADQVADISTITPTAAASYLARAKSVEPASKPTPYAWYALIGVGGLGLLVVLILMLAR